VINTLTIKEPIWNGGQRAVGVRVDRLIDDLWIEIDTVDKHGNRIYPARYYITKQRASLYETKTYPWGEAYIIPIEDL
jgi:hypothetical protein